jgi:hypothetical protein
MDVIEKICLICGAFKENLFFVTLYSFVKLKVRILASTNCKVLFHQFFIQIFFIVEAIF